MTKAKLSFLTAFILAVKLVTFPSVAIAADKVALVIAEGAYEHFSPAPRGIENGELMADQLESLGFEIQVQLEAGDAGVRAALRRFADRAANAKVAVIALSGHVVTARGSAFWLPKNAKIRRSTDLLSRGISVPSAAMIVGKAQQGGAVLVLATQADIPSTIADADARPGHGGPAIKNVAIAFSGSSKAAVSRLNDLAAAAAARLEAATPAATVMLGDLVTAIGGDKTGLVVGESPDITLKAPPPPKPKPAPKPVETPVAALPDKVETVAALVDATERASGGEPPAPVKPEPVEQPEAPEKPAAPTAVEKPADPVDTVAAATPAPDQPEEDASTDAAPEQPTEAAAQPADGGALSVGTLETLEGMLGWRQKSMLQRRLRSPGYYKGPIDGIFGPLTRQAIKDYQTELGEEVTGYLTPTQIETLSAQQ